MIDISIVIPFHSNADFLLTCLSATKQIVRDGIEIIVIQNNSDSRQLVNLEYDNHLQTLYFSENLGYSKACNIGAEVSKGNLLVFCDADSIPLSGDWLDAHIYEFSNHSTVGITSSKLIDPSTGRIMDFGIGWSGYNHFHPFFGASLNDPRIQRNRRVQMACSAHMMIRKEIFQKMGGFDETLKYHFQDVDLCLGLKRLNLTVSVIAGAKAFHRKHSAQVNRSAFQIDERGYYTAKNKNILDIDYGNYLSESLSNLGSQTDPSALYSVINLSTIYQLEEVIEETKKYVQSRRYKSFHLNLRDPAHLNLFEIVGREPAFRPDPLMFIVDTIESLHHNDLWFWLRSNDRDIVIDRHGNASMITDLLVSP